MLIHNRQRTCGAGFSLLSLLVFAGVMMTVLLSLYSISLNQQKRNKSLEQKMESLEFQMVLNRVLSEPLSCACIFTQPQAIRLPLGSPVPIAINNIRQGCAGGSWVSPGGPLPGTKTGLKIQNIVIEGITDLGFNFYTATLKIDFTSDSMVAALNPISITKAFSVDATNQITSCVDFNKASLVSLCHQTQGATFDPINGRCTITQTQTASGSPYSYQLGSPCGSDWMGAEMYDRSGQRKCCYVSATSGGYQASCF